MEEQGNINIAQLATPDIIKNLPEFRGDMNELHSFISTVNQVATIIDIAPVTIRPFWSLALRNKIKGVASDRLRLCGGPTDWENIRTCLLQHFDDHRDQRTLYHQLSILKQNNLSIHEFNNKVLELVTALNSKVTNEEENNEIKQLLILRNCKEGLETFINGSKEPLKTILLARNPQTLHDAYNIALQIQIDVQPNQNLINLYKYLQPV